MKILITGSREFTSKDLIFKALKEHLPSAGLFNEYAHGDAGGADRLSDKILREEFGIPNEKIHRFPVPNMEWIKFGKAAGVLRNQRMLETFNPDLVLAFKKMSAKNRGTNDMIERSLRAGKTVIITPEL